MAVRTDCNEVRTKTTKSQHSLVELEQASFKIKLVVFYMALAVFFNKEDTRIYVKTAPAIYVAYMCNMQYV